MTCCMITNSLRGLCGCEAKKIPQFVSEIMRPKISPIFFSQLVEQAPGRVRKRLDSEPNVADSWGWTHHDKTYGQFRPMRKPFVFSCQWCPYKPRGCSLFLPDVPKCFHILACCSSLPLEHSQSPRRLVSSEPRSTEASPPSEVELDDRTVAVNDAMRASANSFAIRSPLCSALAHAMPES